MKKLLLLLVLPGAHTSFAMEGLPGDSETKTESAVVSLKSRCMAEVADAKKSYDVSQLRGTPMYDEVKEKTLKQLGTVTLPSAQELRAKCEALCLQDFAKGPIISELADKRLDSTVIIWIVEREWGAYRNGKIAQNPQMPKGQRNSLAALGLMRKLLLKDLLKEYPAALELHKAETRDVQQMMESGEL